MDSASIRVGQGFDKVPQAITGFDVDKQAALLIEYHADAEEELREKEGKGSQLLRELPLQSPAAFSADAATRTTAWNFRKGLYAQVAEARPSGTTALLEDIVLGCPCPSALDPELPKNGSGGKCNPIAGECVLLGPVPLPSVREYGTAEP